MRVAAKYDNVRYIQWWWFALEEFHSSATTAVSNDTCLDGLFDLFYEFDELLTGQFAGGVAWQ